MKKTTPIIFIIIALGLSVVFILVNFIVFPRKYSSDIAFYAQKYGIDVALVYSIIKTESNFNSEAVSKAGALGLMQLLPLTASWIAEQLGEDYSDENLFIPQKNIEYGCFYLRYLFDKFNNLDIVICAYNAGETAVRNWIDNIKKLDESKIDFAETKNYLKKVRFFMRIYSS